MTDVIDQTARDRAGDAIHGLNNHIQVTEIKITAVEKKIDAYHVESKQQLAQLMAIMKWAGGLIVMLFISTLTWSLTQQYNANEVSKKDMAQQIELLRAQNENSVRARNDREEILSRLATGTAEPASAPVSKR